MRNFILPFFVLLPFSTIFCQTLAITAEGDTIQVFENGTWKPLTEENQKAELIGSVEAEVEVDEFTNSKKVKTPFWAGIGKDENGNILSGYLIKVNNSYVFRMRSTADLECISEHSSKMIVKLENGETVEMAQIGDTDCGDSPLGMYMVVAREDLKATDTEFQTKQEENLQELLKYNWTAIRLHGSKYYTDFTPNTTKKVAKPEQFFRQHISAVMDK